MLTMYLLQTHFKHYYHCNFYHLCAIFSGKTTLVFVWSKFRFIHSSSYDLIGIFCLRFCFFSGKHIARVLLYLPRETNIHTECFIKLIHFPFEMLDIEIFMGIPCCKCRLAIFHVCSISEGTNSQLKW